MQILLKTLLKEVEEKAPLQVQVYVDMDGVLVAMEEGFQKISGGLTCKEYEKQSGKKIWKIINQKDPATGRLKYPNFWLDLEPKPDAKILWDFIKDNFKNPPPVVLSAGQGPSLIQQKTQWIHKHIDPSVKVIISPSGHEKPNYIFQASPGQRITHVLVDDTQKNINVWDNEAKHQVAILHTDAASSIDQLKAFLPEVK
jgi:hypothetical protein